MRCSQLEPRLNYVLDRREDPRLDAEIAAHIIACRRCRRLTAAYVTMAEGAADLASLSPSSIEAAKSECGRRTGRTLVKRADVGAFAAVAALVLAYLSTSTAGPKAVAPVAESNVAVRTVSAETQSPKPIAHALAVAEMVRNTGRASVELIHDTARGVDGAFTLAASLPSPGELLQPVIFTEDGLLKRIGDQWAPAAGETLESLERALAQEPAVRS